MKNQILSIAFLLSINIILAQQPQETLNKWASSQTTSFSANDVEDYMKASQTEGDITFGPEFTFSDENTGHLSVAAIDETHFVIAYTRASNESQGASVVGTISGNTITYGEEVIFYQIKWTGNISVIHLNENRFVVVFIPGFPTASKFGKARVGFVDGDVITYPSSEYIFNPAYTVSLSATTLDTNRFVVAYEDGGNSSYGTAIVGTVTGSSIAFGPENVFQSVITKDISVTAPTTNNFAIVYRNASTNNAGMAVVGSVSGNEISFGPSDTFFADQSTSISSSSLNENQIIVAYEAIGSPNFGTSFIATLSGNTISFGPEYVFNASNTGNISVICMDENHFVISFSNSNNGAFGTAIAGTVSGTTITYGVESVFNDASTANITTTSIDNSHFVSAYRDEGNLYFGTAVVGEVEGGVISWTAPGENWDDMIEIFGANDHVEIRANIPVDAIINIYSIGGQLIKTEKFQHRNSTSIKLDNTKGIVMVSVVSSEQSLTKKIFLR
jgi:hypothetical protein